MSVNSCQKGKRGEREAVKLLASMGFVDARRTAQHNGQSEDAESDVVCPHTLPDLHIEVKFGGDGQRWGPGLYELQNACHQAKRDSHGSPWVVLHRANREKLWKATAELEGLVVTVAGESDIGRLLFKLAEANR